MNVRRLNVNVGGIPSKGFSGSRSKFRQIESLVGAKLPESYVDFIREADGGHPEIGCFFAQSGDVNDLHGVDWFYALENPAVESVADTILGWRSTLGPKTLPIGRDGGGNQIYLDLSGDTSTVWMYLHDEGGIRLRVADSLEEFLESLVSNPEFI
jgi:hypothetical protein